MTTETRPDVVLESISNSTDGEPVLARYFLRDALDILRPNIDAGPKDCAKFRKQRLLGSRGEVRGPHDVEHDLLKRRLHDLQLLNSWDGRQRALDQGHA